LDLWILGIGAVIAVAGGALFVFLIVTSLFFGKRLERERVMTQHPYLDPMSLMIMVHILVLKHLVPWS
jgi:hypothetical protein